MRITSPKPSRRSSPEPERAFDHSGVTEDWQTPADPLQRRAAALRYELARRIAAGGLVVDVACGTGFGVEHVRRGGGRAVGGDLSEPNLCRARSLAPDGHWLRLDAQQLPIRADVADVVACFEALYYLPDPQSFVAEAYRVLRRGGHLLVTVPNPARSGFSPSPGSIAYHTPSDLFALLAGAGFAADVLGAFAVRSARLLEAAGRALARTRLMPSTIGGRARLKRLLVRDMKPLTPLEPIDHPMHELSPLLRGGYTGDEFRVLYAIGCK